MASQRHYTRPRFANRWQQQAIALPKLGIELGAANIRGNDLLVAPSRA
jgi:hypothetical protein